MISLALTALATIAIGIDEGEGDVEVRCPSAVVDPDALRASLRLELPHVDVVRATCEPTGRAGEAQVVFELAGGATVSVPVGDVLLSLRPRAAALALEAHLASMVKGTASLDTTEELREDRAGDGTTTPADATPTATSRAFAPTSWSLDASGQFATFGTLYAGGELSRRIGLTGWRPAASPFGVSLVLAVSFLGTDAWRVEDASGALPPWSLGIWARTGVEVDFAVSQTLRVGPELLVGGGADLLRDGTIGYGLAAAGLHLGWAFAPGVELVVALRAALQWNTQEALPGFEATVGIRFPLRSLSDEPP